MLAVVPHDTEVMKARMCPTKQGLIAAVNNKGLINLFQLSGITKGAQASHVACLYGLKEETFCLNWSKHNTICSAAGSTVCIWDVNSLHSYKH